MPCADLDSCPALCRLLIAGTDSSDLQQILSLLESTEDLLLTSSYLSTSTFTGKHTNFLVTQYLDAFGSRWCSWSVSTTVVGEGAGGLWEEESVGRWRQRRALRFTSDSIPAAVSVGAPDFLRATSPPPTLPAAALHPARDPSFQLRRRDWPRGSCPSWTGITCCLPSTVGEAAFVCHGGSVAGGGQARALGRHVCWIASRPPGQPLCGLGRLFHFSDSWSSLP